MKREDALELISKYFDRVIEENDLLQLREWLEASDDHIDLFAEQAVMHTQMHRVLTTQDINGIRDSILGPAAYGRDHSDSDIQNAILSSHDSHAYDLEELKDFACAPAVGRPERVEQIPIESDATHKIGGVPGLAVYRSNARGRARIGIEVSRLFAAAIVLLAVGLATLVILNWPSDPDPVPAAPVVVATLSQVNGADWSSPQMADVLPGGALVQGRYDLHAGFAEIQMNRGATVMLQAPCAFELLDDNTVLLDRGRLVANVPPSAKHFTVKTDAMDVVDLGTEFGVNASYTRTDTAVFDGVVELHTPGSEESVEGAPTLTEGWQAGAAVNDPVPTGFQPIRPDHPFVRTIDEARSELEIDGPCKRHRFAPEDLSYHGLTTLDQSIIFLERSNVTVDPSLRDRLNAVPRLGDAEDPSARATEPALIDSYLIHRHANHQFSEISFSVRFPRRVVGVITDSNGLAATDATLCHPGTRYPVDHNAPDGSYYLKRGFELKGVTKDEYTLSNDGHTVHITFRSGLIEQVRVLIESDPES